MKNIKNPCLVASTTEQGENEKNNLNIITQTTRCEFPVESYIDIEAAFTQPQKVLDFVLPGLLSGTVGSIVGVGGTGKSYLSIEMALAVASGYDLTGVFPVGNTRGRAVYLNAEDPTPVIFNRLNAMAKWLDRDIRELAYQNLTVLSLTGRGIALLNANVDRTGWVEPILNIAKGARLLIFDTARRFQLANENDSGAMALFMGIFEEIALKTGCTIVFCHHCAKGSALNGNGDNQAASRGSSVLVDNARWQVNVVGMSEKEAKDIEIKSDRKKYIRIANSKANYNEQFEDIWLEKTEGGVLRKANLGVDKNKGRWQI